jgi:hypothetical protein
LETARERERERESAQVRQGREAKRKAMQDSKATPAEEEAVDQLRAALLHPHGTALERRQRLLAAWTSLRNSVVPNSQPQGKSPQHVDSWTSQHPKHMRLKPYKSSCGSFCGQTKCPQNRMCHTVPQTEMGLLGHPPVCLLVDKGLWKHMAADKAIPIWTDLHFCVPNPSAEFLGSKQGSLASSCLHGFQSAWSSWQRSHVLWLRLTLVVTSWIYLWNKVLKVYHVISLTNVLNQSMQVLKWFTCLMFIPISQLLLSWELSTVNFTGFWGFVVVKSFFISQMVSLIVLLNNKGCPLKILLKWTRGLLNKEEFLFRISAIGVFRVILYKVL